MSWEVEDREISGVERMHVLHCEPHRGWRQRIVYRHDLREAALFGDEKTQALDEIGFVRVARALLPPGKDLPVSALADPFLLMLAKCSALQAFAIPVPTAFRFAQSGTCSTLLRDMREVRRGGPARETFQGSGNNRRGDGPPILRDKPPGYRPRSSSLWPNTYGSARVKCCER